MQEKINKIINDVNNAIIQSNEDAMNFQKMYLSKKGILNNRFFSQRGVCPISAFGSVRPSSCRC